MDKNAVSDSQFRPLLLTPKRLVIGVSIAAIVLVALMSSPFLIMWFTFGSGGGRGELMGTWETSKNKVKVRVREYAEKDPVWLTRFCYVFDAAPFDSGEWRELFETWTDDDVPMPRDSVRFLNDRIAYMSMGEKLAATTDGGGSWSVWDATKEIPDWQCCNQYFIDKSDIALDGRGRMTLVPRFHNNSPTIELLTKDYGVYWRFPWDPDR